MSTKLLAPSDRSPSVAHITVGEAMHAGVISFPPETDLVTIAHAMADHRIHAVVISGIDRSEHGDRLTWSLLTSLDVVAAVLPGNEGAYARELAGGEIVTVEPSEPLETAAQLMVEHDITHLLVVGPTGEPVGIVSSLDVVD